MSVFYASMPIDIVKASGSEVDAEHLPILEEYLAQEYAESRRRYLVFGGQKQIDEKWHAKHNGGRTKIDGVAVTDPVALRHAVIPAYEAICADIRRVLPDFTILLPERLHCTRHENSRFGHVGSAVERIIDEAPAHDTAIGFLGVDAAHPEQLLNVNADVIVTALLKKYAADVRSITMLTPSGGIYDNDKNIVGTLTSTDITKILNMQHREISPIGGAHKKLEEVSVMLTLIDAVRIASVRELTGNPQAGTLCVRSR